MENVGFAASSELEMEALAATSVQRLDSGDFVAAGDSQEGTALSSSQGE